MKQFLSFLLLTFLLSACDDGELTQVSFEFDDSPAEACNSNSATVEGEDNFFIYKTQDKRALIIQIPEENFPNVVTADQNPQLPVLVINGSSNRVIYREYSGTVSESTICSAVPPATPIVVLERKATSGTITVTTTAIKTEPDSNGATQITHFLHTLTFNDLVFELGDENKQINEAFTQITYRTLATGFTNFSTLTNVRSCENDPTYLFKYENKQALILDLSDEDAAALFSDEPGPKKRYFSDDTKLQHLFYDTSFAFLNDDYFCIPPQPTNPEVIDTFTSVNGVVDESGIIEVTTLASDNGFKHTIILKNVRLAKGTLTRQLGNEFIFGEFETPN